MSTPPNPTPDSAAKVASPKVDRKTRVYEVSSLDTLHSIALKFNMKTGELLRLNGLPSTYRIYSGQHLTVFENSTPTPTSTPPTRHFDKTIDLNNSHDKHDRSSDMQFNFLEQTGKSKHHHHHHHHHGHQRNPSIADMSFPSVITPSYSYVPLLALLRQNRDKKYFGDNRSTPAVHQGLSDSLAANSMSNRRPVSPLGSSFHHIPDEMRLNSKDVIKEHVRYYINEQRNVLGELTLMPSNLIFEPALDDPVTRQLGMLNCQFQCDLKDVIDVHIIEAAEVLAWWRSQLPQSESPTQRKDSKPRSGSLGQGPSSTHLNTGSGYSSPSVAAAGSQIDAILDRFEEGSEKGPRFLQLTVMVGKPSEGTQTGKIIYFLINRQTVELFYQKIQVWCAQSRPTTVRKPNPGPNILAQKAVTTSYLDAEKAPAPPPPTIDPVVPAAAPSEAPKASPALDISQIDTPKLNFNSVLITEETTLKKLVSAMPARYRNSDWTLLYSTERHGVSLQTFFNKTRRKGPSYLFIEDDAGFVFGAYISESWEPQRSYYGTGECFLFTIYPTFNIYTWSGLNEFFIYSREDTLAVGGGAGKFGLWLDQDLMLGSSAPCDTFLNSTLSCQEDFRVTIIEVWGFNDAIAKNSH